MSKINIAYDMDGVLLPDFHQIPGWTEDEFFEHTIYAKPMFSPLGDFDVVTARTEARRGITESWLKQLDTPPQNVFMNPDRVLTPAEFKFKTCVEQGYKIYVESDPGSVWEMRELVCEAKIDLLVVHFSEFVAQQLKIQ